MSAITESFLASRASRGDLLIFAGELTAASGLGSLAALEVLEDGSEVVRDLLVPAMKDAGGELAAGLGRHEDF